MAYKTNGYDQMETTKWDDTSNAVCRPARTDVDGGTIVNRNDVGNGILDGSDQVTNYDQESEPDNRKLIVQALEPRRTF